MITLLKIQERVHKAQEKVQELQKAQCELEEQLFSYYKGDPVDNFEDTIYFMRALGIPLDTLAGFQRLSVR